MKMQKGDKLSNKSNKRRKVLLPLLNPINYLKKSFRPKLKQLMMLVYNKKLKSVIML